MVGDGVFVIMFVLDTHFAPTSIHVRCCCTATTTAAFLFFIPSVLVEPSKVVHLLSVNLDHVHLFILFSEH